MTQLDCQAASEFALADVADMLTRSFEGYFIPIVMDEAHLLTMIRLHSVDLSASRVVTADAAPAGIALMARRGWACRVAGMGVYSGWRGLGLGRFLMQRLVEEAVSRRDHEMVLEVIEQNDPAIRLYESVGFRKVRRLVSLELDSYEPGEPDELEEIDIRELGRLVGCRGLPDLPWQLSAETVGQYTAPYRAYRRGAASALISDPALPDVRFAALLSEPSAEGDEQATALVRALVHAHPAKSWHVPAIFPEESVKPLLAAGFHHETLSQWQMALDVAGRAA